MMARSSNPQHRAASARRARPPRRSVLWTIVGVIGELFITVGVLIFLFVGWQVWWYDPSVARSQVAVAQQYLDEFRSGASSSATPSDQDSTEEDDATVPVVSRPSSVGDVWAVLYAPRFGSDWIRPVAWGVDMQSVLNKIGVGTYEQSTMPGETGNTIIASHRGGMGSSFYNIHKLRLGDQIVLETSDGWYTYDYRNTVYVLDTGVGILDPVPQMDGQTATGSILTLQSCNPLPVSTNERIIAYAVFDSFTPRSAGAPAAISGEVQ